MILRVEVVTNNKDTYKSGKVLTDGGRWYWPLSVTDDRWEVPKEGSKVVVCGDYYLAGVQNVDIMVRGDVDTLFREVANLNEEITELKKQIEKIKQPVEDPAKEINFDPYIFKLESNGSLTIKDSQHHRLCWLSNLAVDVLRRHLNGSSDKEKRLGTVKVNSNESPFAVIARLERELITQREEWEKTLDEGYEEAYQLLMEERKKKEDLEVVLHDEYENKFKEAREFIITKVDEYLNKLYTETGGDIRKLRESKTAHQIVEEAVGEMNTPDISKLEARCMRLTVEVAKLKEQARKSGEVSINKEDCKGKLPPPLPKDKKGGTWLEI